MTPDSKILELIASATDEKVAAVLKELLAERRLARQQLLRMMEARDFYQRQQELGAFTEEFLKLVR